MKTRCRSYRCLGVFKNHKYMKIHCLFGMKIFFFNQNLPPPRKRLIGCVTASTSQLSYWDHNDLVLLDEPKSSATSVKAHIQGPSEDGLGKQVRELLELQDFLQGLLYMPAEVAFEFVEKCGKILNGCSQSGGLVKHSGAFQQVDTLGISSSSEHRCSTVANGGNGSYLANKM
ncbi:hypothetical protein STEG23_032814 [Scotinomys teguina]